MPICSWLFHVHQCQLLYMQQAWMFNLRLRLPSARIMFSVSCLLLALLCCSSKSFFLYMCRPLIGGRIVLTKFGYPSERLLRLAEPKKYLPAFLEKR